VHGRDGDGETYLAALRFLAVLRFLAARERNKLTPCERIIQKVRESKGADQFLYE
jgi:hypothetical protein